MDSNQIREELRQKGIKNTRAKSVLLHLLKNNNAPIDVNSLYSECLKETSVNLVTVYRSLQQFYEKGLVQEFLGKNGVTHYEYIYQGFNSHPHFQCETCHNVICLDELSSADILYFSNMARQHKINTINITLTGICERCKKSIS